MIAQLWLALSVRRARALEASRSVTDASARTDPSGLCFIPSKKAAAAAAAAQHQHDYISVVDGLFRTMYVTTGDTLLAATTTATYLYCAVLSPPKNSSGSSFPSRCASVPSVAMRGFSAAGAAAGRDAAGGAADARAASKAAWFCAGPSPVNRASRAARASSTSRALAFGAGRAAL